MPAIWWFLTIFLMEVTAYSLLPMLTTKDIAMVLMELS